MAYVVDHVGQQDLAIRGSLEPQNGFLDQVIRVSGRRFELGKGGLIDGRVWIPKRTVSGPVGAERERLRGREVRGCEERPRAASGGSSTKGAATTPSCGRVDPGVSGAGGSVEARRSSGGVEAATAWF